MYSMNEPATLQREVEAITIPSGEPLMLPENTLCFITQALGGSFTVYVEGNLYRIGGQDADALGKEVPPVPELPMNPTDKDFEVAIWDQMRSCYDPEIPVNIVDLGLIYGAEIEKQGDTRKVAVEMTLTAPGCGMGEVLVRDVKERIELIPTISEAHVELVFDPPWSQERMSEAAKLQTGML